MKNAAKKFVGLALPELEAIAWQNMDCCTDMRRRLSGGQIVYGAPAEKYKTIKLKAKKFSKGDF